MPSCCRGWRDCHACISARQPGAEAVPRKASTTADGPEATSSFVSCVFSLITCAAGQATVACSRRSPGWGCGEADETGIQNNKEIWQQLQGLSSGASGVTNGDTGSRYQMEVLSSPIVKLCQKRGKVWKAAPARVCLIVTPSGRVEGRGRGRHKHTGDSAKPDHGHLYGVQGVELQA